MAITCLVEHYTLETIIECTMLRKYVTHLHILSRGTLCAPEKTNLFNVNIRSTNSYIRFLSMLVAYQLACVCVCVLDV